MRREASQPGAAAVENSLDRRSPNAYSGTLARQTLVGLARLDVPGKVGRYDAGSDDRYHAYSPAPDRVLVELGLPCEPSRRLRRGGAHHFLQCDHEQIQEVHAVDGGPDAARICLLAAAASVAAGSWLGSGPASGGARRRRRGICDPGRPYFDFRDRLRLPPDIHDLGLSVLDAWSGTASRVHREVGESRGVARVSSDCKAGGI